MGPRRVVVGDPGSDDLASLIEVQKQALVEKFVAHAAVEGFDVAILHRFAGSDVVPFDVCSCCQARMAFEVSSVPLSDTIIRGLPRSSMSVVSSRATRLPEIEVSGMAARHSRVTSSIMLRIRKRRPACRRAPWGGRISGNPAEADVTAVSICWYATANDYALHNSS